ncbi:HTTM domain-containing protein, partial [Flavobacterium sp.]|uniref:HTTM domain-containing protein n=1 Tax=Flavobacterium sp. TaxID=239 RepID=UPI002628BF9E
MKRFYKYLNKTTEAAPLAIFRILFGVLMFFSLIRFMANGWVKTLYIEPKFFFSYYGFEWIKPLGIYTYLIFLICMLSCIMITLGYRYRLAILLFFVSFTYIE